MPDFDNAQTQHQITQALRLIGMSDISADYDDQVIGRRDGFKFVDAETHAAIGRADLFSRLDLCLANDRSPKATHDGKIAWVTAFKNFINDDHAPLSPDAAIVSEETANQVPFRQLLNNASHLKALTPVHWDLNEKDLPRVVQALNNIARMQNFDVRFQTDAKGKIEFYAKNSDHPLSRGAMDNQVTSIIQSIVESDQSLASIDFDFNSGSKKASLNNDGRQALVKMVAYRENGRDYIALDKSAGVGPNKESAIGNTAYVVDLIENAQIAIASKKYLNFEYTQAANKEPYIIQRKKDEVMSNDGDDTYKFTNNNVAAIPDKYDLTNTNERSAVPGVKGPQKVESETERNMIRILNALRGAMPLEMSSDAEIVVQAPPAHLKLHSSTQHHGAKVRKDAPCK